MIIEHPEFEVVVTSMGVPSIRNKILNEIMHNPVGPEKEAKDLYVIPSRMQERLESGEGPLVIFDVGLGAAANALAAIECFFQAQTSRSLHLISFERNLELLKFTLFHKNYFPLVLKHAELLETLLETRKVQVGKLTWELHEGLFANTLENATANPEVIFYDPYSPKMNPEMWSLDAFLKLKKFLDRQPKLACQLLTYSQATPVRSALIGAGFFVGYGPSTGLKEETTHAATERDLLPLPLDQKWYRRWASSHRRYPILCFDQHWWVDLKVNQYFAEGSRPSGS